MTPDQFWYDNPQLFYNYEEKFIAETKRKEVEMWTLGIVLKSAMQSTVIPVGLYKNASDIPQYMECPHKDEINEQTEMTESEMEAERLKHYMSAKMIELRSKTSNK